MQRLALILALAFGGSAATASGQQATTGQRPQEPKPPFPYRSIEVQYANPAAPGVTLAATLTLPPGKGSSPAALLIGGSGEFTVWLDDKLLAEKKLGMFPDASAVVAAVKAAIAST